LNYSRTTRPTTNVRTLNPSEIRVAQYLESNGYTVVKRGWPDFLAWKNGTIRFIEVKPNKRHKLKASQQLVSDALKHAFGVTVEMMTPDDCE